jgi:hypothetical protein
MLTVHNPPACESIATFGAAMPASDCAVTTLAPITGTGEGP